ncbi:MULTISPECIES: Asp-tRNA(Asn)/Glu-tRNA(Gln) amidotransferase subunit GatA [unclassified Gemella]|uniref:Asp-tRNA(Asn)/Glu-tRNA(Gln) amidotransferase subunit GatA n=1 Tax=unclassified Gemella TaxID=2624949 RepID=UPI0010733D32|nr:MULTISPECIES: Asp-tRNA(Asn)/Glu-tRNA(Gln) amidotransferase subunit GatA [unclassified Gemella]MBF0710120.1 Asp-tRNA(Asn)/Glu-tRNA(Gln) amidotransferase subunit GatA [Gemella sp. GL1.1]MBF0746199.1 Asp-tRNA(Asn)/Glu-tRNA(Gln) amidotransferase subunit GatA [Gemella sp. 19428wG2_WT2a]NYS27464.1 Asp-tRNA(Asn)/Glu-tRNA(Gln) amidotransferase subunit GatA [Gemella sp. GL1]TFU60483.1 Asp-tRNA(Asn)/Glu-tRNA(Gln) amidotransferase subunit GatA [Gemella sp. WT2a]
MTLMYESIENLELKLKNKEIKPSELAMASFKKIKTTDDKIGSFISITEEVALEKAKELDLKQEQGKNTGKLFGIPMGIKDNIITKNIDTTCASKILEGFNPIYDATVMIKLHKENPIIVGKLNMDEFAMGGSTETSYYKLTRNPHDLIAVPGGSSGGSATAVAAGQVPFTLGSDTGGSVRQPASYCGVIGLKPTYGRVSRFGLVAYASSLDQIGPMTRTVKDNARVLEIISGLDENDMTSAPIDVPKFSEIITGDVDGLRIALPKEYFGDGIDVEVKESVKKAVRYLESQGAIVEEVSLPNTINTIEAYYIIASAEASSNLSRFDGIRYGYRNEEASNLEEVYKKTRGEGFGSEVKRRIMLGTYVLSSGYYDAYYKKAQKVRTLIKNDFDKVFENYDVIIGPTTPTVAFNIGEEISDSVTMFANDILTTPINMAGLPAISIPCGFKGKRPIGMQIIGKPFAETTIYDVAYNFEQHYNLHDKKIEL